MFRRIRRSLLLRVGIALALITVFALFGIVSSVIIAETLRGAASAINSAGALRMQTYAISTELLQTETDPAAHRARVEGALAHFDAKYRTPALTQTIPVHPNDPARAAYADIGTTWATVIRPRLLQALEATAFEPLRDGGLEAHSRPPQTHSSDRSRWEMSRWATVAPGVPGLDPLPIRHAFPLLRADLDAFVGRIDHLVGLLEAQTEAKIQRLRFTQGVSLLLTLAVVGITLFFLRHQVLLPLRHLLGAAEAVRQRDFSWRIQHTGDDELGHLGATFNRMASDLSQTYEELEARVREKTEDLERTNRSLKLMYSSLIHLHDTRLSQEAYTQTLEEVAHFLGLGSGSICVVEPDGRKGFRMAETGPQAVRHATDADPAGKTLSSGEIPTGEEPARARSEHFDPIRCEQPSCDSCLTHATTRLNRTHNSARNPGAQVLTVPLREGERLHGLLSLQVPEGMHLEPWQIQLVEGVAQHLAAAIGKQQRTDQHHRLALLEERATIARELHDSLAQALTYLKIQVSRLQGMVQRPGREAEVQSTLHDLREGLNTAYRDLRELLTTFRIRMDEKGLNQALESTVQEFSERGPLAIRLNNRIANGELGVNAEIHVLQIVREALSNVIKHADARVATVELTASPRGHVDVVIEDDGHGLPEAVDKPGHYGLAIMRERARNLGAQLHLGTGRQGGTRIRLRFDRHGHVPVPNLTLNEV